MADALLACGVPAPGEGPKSGSALAARKKAWVAPTAHKMGIVVPYDKETEVGYRALDPKGAELRKLLDKLEKSTGAVKDAALQPERPRESCMITSRLIGNRHSKGFTPYTFRHLKH